jgi:hypothetical protein
MTKCQEGDCRDPDARGTINVQSSWSFIMGVLGVCLRAFNDKYISFQLYHRSFSANSSSATLDHVVLVGQEPNNSVYLAP